MPPDSSDREGFAHRENHDGSFDTFCRACLRTLGTANREADLESFERSHVCDPYEVARFKSPVREEADGDTEGGAESSVA